jgi:hypothetical protein
MIIKATSNGKDCTYFDKAVRFQATKTNYVNYKLPVGSLYEVRRMGDGLYSMPSARNKVN